LAWRTSETLEENWESRTAEGGMQYMIVSEAIEKEAPKDPSHYILRLPEQGCFRQRHISVISEVVNHPPIDRTYHRILQLADNAGEVRSTLGLTVEHVARTDTEGELAAHQVDTAVGVGNVHVRPRLDLAADDGRVGEGVGEQADSGNVVGTIPVHGIDVSHRAADCVVASGPAESQVGLPLRHSGSRGGQQVGDTYGIHFGTVDGVLEQELIHHGGLQAEAEVAPVIKAEAIACGNVIGRHLHALRIDVTR